MSRRWRTRSPFGSPSWAGVFGVTFVVAFAAALLAGGATGRTSACPSRVACVALACGGPSRPGCHPVRRPPPDAPIDVAAIQVDFREGVRGPSREEGDVAVTRLNLDLHRTLKEDSPNLAVWGESALDPGVLSIIDEVRTTSPTSGCRWWRGDLDQTGRTRPRTTPCTIRPSVRRRGSGGRRLPQDPPVPYGEYIPWKPIWGGTLPSSRSPTSSRRGSGCTPSPPRDSRCSPHPSASRTASPRWTGSSFVKVRSSSWS